MSSHFLNNCLFVAVDPKPQDHFDMEDGHEMFCNIISEKKRNKNALQPFPNNAKAQILEENFDYQVICRISQFHKIKIKIIKPIFKLKRVVKFLMKTIFQCLIFLDPFNQSNFTLHFMYMFHGAGKTAKCLRALALLGEGLGSVPSSHIG